MNGPEITPGRKQNGRRRKHISRVFRFKKGIEVEYDLQGYIYFTSRRFRKLPKGQQALIRSLVREVAPGYEKALLEFLTTDSSAVAVCMKYHLSESTLERLARRYYERAAGKL